MSEPRNNRARSRAAGTNSRSTGANARTSGASARTSGTNARSTGTNARSARASTRKTQTRRPVQQSRTPLSRRHQQTTRTSRSANPERLVHPTSERVFPKQANSETTTVGERRRSIQREKRAKKGRAISIKLLVVAIILVGLIATLFILYNSNFLAVSEVQVQGAEHLSSEHLTELAAVPVDSTLLRVDADGIAERLQADPWVKSASVERQLPGILILHIQERPIAAQVEIIPDAASAQISRWLISDDAVWLGALGDSEQAIIISSEQVANLPMFKDVSRAVRPEIGAQTTDDGIVNALAILKGFSLEMREIVSSVSAPDATRTTLNLKNNVGVAFGAAEDIAAKETAIKTLLDAHAGTITYINVRVPDRATYRAVE